MNFKSKAKLSTIDDTGFGTNANNYGGRFINSNGTPNLKKTGVPFLDSISWFHKLLTMRGWKFLLLVFVFYFLINFFFASIYYTIGVDHLNGINATSEIEKFGQAFFFSIQTYTTVGYGHINPSGFMSSFVAAVEALLGLLSFAIATGLFYGRFSRPEAFVKFSENMLVAPYRDGTAIMFRICDYKNTNLIDVEAKLTFAYQIEENGVLTNKFTPLKLEIDKIAALTLSWTIVHHITSESPLYGLTEQDYKTSKGEVIVLIKSFEDLYSVNVFKRRSYTFGEFVYGAKFIPMFYQSPDNEKTILDVDKLSSFDKVVMN
jgi:inward rectifier potassium channel